VIFKITNHKLYLNFKTENQAITFVSVWCHLTCCTHSGTHGYSSMRALIRSVRRGSHLSPSAAIPTTFASHTFSCLPFVMVQYLTSLQSPILLHFYLLALTLLADYRYQSSSILPPFLCWRTAWSSAPSRPMCYLYVVCHLWWHIFNHRKGYLLRSHSANPVFLNTHLNS